MYLFSPLFFEMHSFGCCQCGAKKQEERWRNSAPTQQHIQHAWVQQKINHYLNVHKRWGQALQGSSAAGGVATVGHVLVVE
jgi:hypothetical protein